MERYGAINGHWPIALLISLILLKENVVWPFCTQKTIYIYIYIYTSRAHKKEQRKSKIQKDIKDITSSNATSSHFRFMLSAYHLLKVTLFSSLSYLYRDTYNLEAIQWKQVSLQEKESLLIFIAGRLLTVSWIWNL